VTTIEDTKLENGGGIWISSDRGQTWHQPASTVRRDSSGVAQPHSAFGISFAVGTNSIYVGTDAGFAVSYDLGSTWTFIDPQADGSPHAIYSILALTSGKVITFGDAGIWMADDGKDHWYQDNAQLPFDGNLIANALAVSPISNDHLFFTNGYDRLFYSLNGGLDWKPVDVVPNTYGGGARQPYLRVTSSGMLPGSPVP
jgi:photosystem II stability/assembly factor-like uncharacterized protein